MQFGRLHGIALVFLAFFLLLTQAWIIVSRPPISITGDDVPQSQDQPWTSYIPGVFGVGFLGLGGYTFVANRNHPDDLPANPIK